MAVVVKVVKLEFDKEWTVPDGWSLVGVQPTEDGAVAILNELPKPSSIIKPKKPEIIT